MESSTFILSSTLDTKFRSKLDIFSSLKKDWKYFISKKICSLYSFFHLTENVQNNFWKQFWKERKECSTIAHIDSHVLKNDLLNFIIFQIIKSWQSNSCILNLMMNESILNYLPDYRRMNYITKIASLELLHLCFPMRWTS